MTETWHLAIVGSALLMGLVVVIGVAQAIRAVREGDIAWGFLFASCAVAGPLLWMAAIHG